MPIGFVSHGCFLSTQDMTLKIISTIYIQATVIPVQAWTATEGSMRLRLPDFKTIGT
jgi:hypothetical protein